jgi:DNA mismatch repair protein MutL
MKKLRSQALPRIRALPERLANQIAAGEVVERPASVLKELLENSLDAGAKRISVDIEHGGARLIRVRDDGVGIHREDLALALDRHATSKIASLEDLENVASLGFRGEALPSIGSVSRLELSSCAIGGESGWKLAAEQSTTQRPLQPVPHPQGTTVTVRDLFYNTPARRKFLRTEKTEYRHLEDVLKRAALSRFDCAFSLRHNARECYSLAAAASDAERGRRVAKLCGAAFMEAALALTFEAFDLHLDGWIGGPGYSRGVSDLQYFFVNGRMVRDNLLRHAVRLAHHGMIESGRQPAYVLFLRMSPAQVDVNVHPSKHEVRFRDARSVHDFVVRCLRQALSAETELTDPRSGEAVFSPGADPGSDLGFQPRSSAAHGSLREHAVAYDALRAGAAAQFDSGAGKQPLGDALQHIDRRYVVARNSDGLVVVDARRACRHVAAAQLAEALGNGSIASRPLLVPVAISVDEATADLLESRAAYLHKLGFDLRRVAHAGVSCRGIPAPLAAASPRDLVLCAAAALIAGAPNLDAAGEFPALLDAVLQKCDLTVAWVWDRDAMNDLLRQLERLPDASHAQGGEIIWRQLSAGDLAALFANRQSRA